jgi:hypothetical protein
MTPDELTYLGEEIVGMYVCSLASCMRLSRTYAQTYGLFNRRHEVGPLHCKIVHPAAHRFAMQTGLPVTSGSAAHPRYTVCEYRSA